MHGDVRTPGGRKVPVRWRFLESAQGRALNHFQVNARYGSRTVWFQSFGQEASKKVSSQNVTSPGVLQPVKDADTLAVVMPMRL